MIHIRKLCSDELPEATVLLAEGMLHNPLHIRAFGQDSERRHQRLHAFIAPLLRMVHANGDVLGAFRDSALIGTLGMMAPGGCQPSPAVALRMAGAIAASNPLAGTFRIFRWLSTWARHDPTEPHWHLGPLTVLAAHRREGVARELMQEACRQLDKTATAGYLETDLAINVSFYESLGFQTLRTQKVLGVPNGFMNRPVASSCS